LPCILSAGLKARSHQLGYRMTSLCKMEFAASEHS
jgi:hypothetical protein